jgi:hypothetical protein
LSEDPDVKRRRALALQVSFTMILLSFITWDLFYTTTNLTLFVIFSLIWCTGSRSREGKSFKF